MPYWKSRLPYLVAATFSAMLVGCLSDSGKLAPSEEQPPVGRVLKPDGEPAGGGARVLLYAVDNLPPVPALPGLGGSAAPAYALLADDEGYYRVDSVRSGQYNVFMSLDGEVALADSVWIYADGKDLPAATLGSAGSLEGVVALEPQHDARKVAVLVVGSGLSASVDAAGGFRMAGLAEGEYELRIVSSWPEYLAGSVHVRVRSGAKTVLDDSIRPQFTGIPVVRGLRTAFDTAHGIATLRWSPSAYPRLRDYEVLRARAPHGEGFVAIGSTRDTVFRDTLLASDGSWAWESPDFGYVVRVRSLGGETGPSGTFVSARTAPPARVRTSIGFEAGFQVRDSLHWDTLSLHADTAGAAELPFLTVSLGDTVSLVARFGNPTRQVRDLAWVERGGADTLRRVLVASDSGADSLKWAAPGTAGRDTLRFVARDAAGQARMGDVVVVTARDVPHAFAGPDTTVSVGDTLILRGRGTDLYGRVAKLEWDAGATGAFLPAPGGILAIKAPGTPTNAYRCVLRAVDDDGQAGFDTLVVRVVPFKRLATSRAARVAHVLEAVDGRFYAMGGTHPDVAAMVEEYDPAANAWRFRASMPSPRMNFSSAVVGGRIYTIGGNTITDGKWAYGKVTTVESYEPATDTWRTHAPVPTIDWAINAAFGYRGRLYAFAEAWRGSRVNLLVEYDPGADAWRDLASPAHNPSAIAVLDGRIFCTVNESQPRYVVRMFEYDLDANVFTAREPLASRAGGYRMASLAGKILLLGGTSHSLPGGTDRSDVFHPDRNLWTPGIPLGKIRMDHAIAPLEGRIFLHGGNAQPYSPLSQQELEAYSPF